MSNSLPNTLQDIITKVRRVTARPSSAQISDAEIVRYINTYYVYDFADELKLESLRYTFNFVTSANQCVYDFPTDSYLTAMPPVYMAGYQSFMTQSRGNFFRINPALNFLQQNVYTGNGGTGPYTGQFLTNVPLVPGFKPNPPGAFSTTAYPVKEINWNVVVSGIDTSGNSQTLVDDGQGNLYDSNDTGTAGVGGTAVIRGSVDYATGAVDINSTGFVSGIASGNPINVQYIPYVASRPQSCLFYQDQIILYPVPDQAYTVSFEAYKYPAFFTVASDGTFDGTLAPQLKEWWQLLAYGAACKIFADNGDFENLQKYRPLLEEQMMLVQRRTIVQQTSERTASIYSEQNGYNQFGFGNYFGGFG